MHFDQILMKQTLVLPFAATAILRTSQRIQDIYIPYPFQDTAWANPFCLNRSHYTLTIDAENHTQVSAWVKPGGGMRNYENLLFDTMILSMACYNGLEKGAAEGGVGTTCYI